MNIKDFKEGQEILSPRTGMPLLVVMRITDGTVKTTFTYQQYGEVDDKGEFRRDKDGRIKVHKSAKYLTPDHFKNQDIKIRLLTDEPDIPEPDNKFVWWAENPTYEAVSAGGTERLRIVTGFDKGTYEDFFAAVDKALKQAEEEKLGLKAAEHEQTAAIAGAVADRVVAGMQHRGNLTFGAEGPLKTETGVPIPPSTGGEEWTAVDDEYIRANYRTMTDAAMAEALNVETKALTDHRLGDLGLKKSG